jgi:hypothetical protein
MGRREAPVEPGPLFEFAQDLRALRAGRTYRELGRRAGYSLSTLSAAAGGSMLPTLEVTLAFVGACGGDMAVWELRWRELYAVVKGDRGWLRDPGGPVGQALRPPVASAQPNGGRPDPAWPGTSRPGARLSPDPTSAGTPAEFIAQMKLLRLWVKNPSLHELSRRVERLGQPDLRLPVSSLSDALRREGQLPPWKLVLAFLCACGVRQTSHRARWEEAWTRITAAQNNLPIPVALERQDVELNVVHDVAAEDDVDELDARRAPGPHPYAAAGPRACAWPS